MKSTPTAGLFYIAYIVGLSIGVHLLNLLAIPAIVFVYYFRKYEVTRKGIIWALVISVALLGVIMYEHYSSIVTVASWFELMFVNSFGLPFHSGVFFYIVLLIGGFSFAIYYTYKHQKVVLNTSHFSRSGNRYRLFIVRNNYYSFVGTTANEPE